MGKFTKKNIKDYYHIVWYDNKVPCVTCGTPTNFRSKKYNRRVCSKECLDKYKKKFDSYL